MGKTLYLECYSGISGDMTVAALLDLGADQKKLVRALKSLPVKGFDIKISRVVRSGIDACDFDVLLDQPPITLASAPSIPATATTQLASWMVSSLEKSLCIPLTPTS